MVKKSKNLKQSQKIIFFFTKTNLLNKKKLQKKRKKMLSSKFSHIRRTQFNQTSPVQPVSESRGGSLSVTE